MFSFLWQSCISGKRKAKIPQEYENVTLKIWAPFFIVDIEIYLKIRDYLKEIGILTL